MSARPRSLAPFGPVELIDFARLFADEVVAGQYPFVEYDPDERWHQRIYRDRRVDVWLISWLPTQGTALHDHGGSSGAFTVIDGELTETVVAGRESAPRSSVELTRRAGDSVGFGAQYIHDVRNVAGHAAVSVHAYSPPLAAMTYYDLQSGELSTIATVQTDDPEHELSPADLRAAS